VGEHHASCQPSDKELVWHCCQCGLNESAEQLETENRELAEQLGGATMAANTLGDERRRLDKQVAELAERVKELEVTLREIGNRAGSPTVHYAPQIERIEQRESLDWIAEQARQALAKKKSSA